MYVFRGHAKRSYRWGAGWEAGKEERLSRWKLVHRPAADGPQTDKNAPRQSDSRLAETNGDERRLDDGNATAALSPGAGARLSPAPDIAATAAAIPAVLDTAGGMRR